MLKKIIVVLSAIIAAFLIIASLQPNEFIVQRSITVKASADKVFNQVNNLKNWKKWSPWEELDPNATSSFEGPEAGKDASMSWAGNYEVGKGKMTITDSTAGKSVKFLLNFEEPMAGISTAEFTFKPEGNDETLVTWTMQGEKNFVSKVFGLIFNCDKMVGAQFEKGLANLKTVAE